MESGSGTAGRSSSLYAGRNRILVALLALFDLAGRVFGRRTPAGRDGSSASRARIVLHTDDVVGPFDQRLLGTNVPAWLSPDVVASDQFRALAVASGTTMLRLPGGSWSNNYDWLGCELGDPDQCRLDLGV